VLSVVRAAHVDLTTEDTEGTEKDFEPEVRGGRAPCLRDLRGPRSEHQVYHGGHGGHGEGSRTGGSRRLSSVPPWSPWSAQRTSI